MTTRRPVCPDCEAEMVKAHVENEEGDWAVHWLCNCEPDPETIAAARAMRPTPLAPTTAYVEQQQIARVCALASKWLKPLGLLWWRKIELQYASDREHFRGDDESEAIMITTANWEYLEAVIEVNLPYVAELDDKMLEYDFVHEAVHILIEEITNKNKGSVERVTTNLARAFLWVEELLG
jgi:hypothetical protein